MANLRNGTVEELLFLSYITKESIRTTRTRKVIQYTIR
jgi:hypothetical protein